MLLENKIAVVTGGTRGIGYAVVKKYLENGATVILCGSRPETAQAAVDKLKSENSAYLVEGISPNLSDFEDVSQTLTAVKEKYGRIDILINNAGVSDSKSFFQYTPQDFDRVMDLNLKAVFNCTRVVADFMKEQQEGVIINTSSMVSKHGQQSGCAYPTSKFAVNGLTISLARELGPYNIRVNAVAPGVTNTDMYQAVPEEYKAPLLRQIPLGRVGEPEEVADAFVYLGSPMASYVSGVILSVDGMAKN